MERRASERYRVWFPMTVVTDQGEQGTAITYDVSASGLLMACPGRLDLQAHVTLRFKLAHGDAPERSIPGTIVRVEENDGEQGPWRYRMAVQFDTVQPNLEAILEANAED